MRARFFAPGDAEGWDAFCAEAFNATFLHSRRFLSYHGDRFLDRSVILEAEGRWLGVMPVAGAPGEAELAVSHPGSTYGGLVHGGALRGEAMDEALREAARLLRGEGFRRLHYKAVPHPYHRVPAQDDLWALQQLGARRFRCDLSCAIDLQAGLPRAERRRRGLRKAQREGVAVAAGPEALPELWSVLEENLARKHGVRPTHRLEEIRLLADRFPKEIQVRVARRLGRVVAGVVLFLGGPTVHAQYIASSEEGYEVGALDAVFDAVLAEAAEQGARFFDFGISTEAQGTRLNEGLYRFKCEFGGSGVVHEFYELDLETACP
jgi:CelD/BcsL family acetyltransferase involved in cellulose biosynthesis